MLKPNQTELDAKAQKLLDDPNAFQDMVSAGDPEAALAAIQFAATFLDMQGIYSKLYLLHIYVIFLYVVN